MNLNYSDYAMFCESQVVALLEETQRSARVQIKERLDSFAGYTVHSVDEVCDLMYSVDQYAFLTVLRGFEASYNERFDFAVLLCKKIGFDLSNPSFHYVLSRSYNAGSDRLAFEFRAAVTDLLDLLP